MGQRFMNIDSELLADILKLPKGTRIVGAMPSVSFMDVLTFKLDIPEKPNVVPGAFIPYVNPQWNADGFLDWGEERLLHGQ